MSRKIAKIYTDEEIINDLTTSRFKVDDYYIQETGSGNYTVCALSEGVSFDFFWEDDQFHTVVLEFLKKRGAKTISWEDYVNNLSKPNK